MNQNIIYLDHAATTQLDPNVLECMMPFLKEDYGNPSSIYSIGIKNKEAINIARNEVAQVLNCSSKEIYFTAGGSESDNLAIKGIARANKNKGKHIITTKIEHPAVLNTCKMLEKEGFELTYLNVDLNGSIFLDELERKIRDDTILISIMFANNEIGTIQNIYEIGKIAKKRNIYFHTDAVQAIGNICIDVQKLNIDALSLSAHKFYGPKGIGALYVRNGVAFNGIINGGHQENGKRAGTENVPGIVGLGKAIALAYKDLDLNNERIKKLRDRYIYLIEKEIAGLRLNGDRENRLPGNANFSFEGVNGNSLAIMLDMKNICVSTGSACTSNKTEPSHVLSAIGLENKYINGAIRATFGKENTMKDVEEVVKVIKNSVKKLRE